MSRSTGRSATAAAAYRSGTKITDIRTGEIHNYTHRDGVELTGLILPESAPHELQDRDNLWNSVELAENRRNSVVAREVLVAIPHELDPDQRKCLVEDFAKSLSDRYQTGVDFAIHDPSERGDERNYHAHIMMTTRRITQNGLGEKTRELDAYKSSGKLEINNIRQSWEAHANQALEQVGITSRIDSRSLKDQGIDREPTKHIGVSGAAIDRKGQFSERAEINMRLRETNRERIELLKELKALHQQKREIGAELSELHGKRKSALQVWKKSERLHDAVKDATASSCEIFQNKQAKHEQHKGWHDREIHKAIQQYHLFKEREPVKKGWFEHENKFEHRAAEVEAEKKLRFEQMHEAIQLHRAPTQENAVDIAVGKAAYQHKIKKTEIKSNLNADSESQVEKNNSYLEKIQEKITARKARRMKTEDRIESRRTMLEQFEKRTELLENQLEQNTKSIKAKTMKIDEKLQPEVPGEDTQAIIDQVSKETRDALAVSQANTEETLAVQHDQEIEALQEIIEESEQSDLLENELEQPERSVVLEGPDYSEGRELEIEMSPQMRQSINEKFEQAGIDPDIAKAWERRDEIRFDRDQEKELEKDEDDLSI